MKKIMISLVESYGNISGKLNHRKQYFRNKFLYKTHQRKKLEYDIMKIFLSRKQQFGGDMLYQTHPKIDLRGQRPTIVRFETYRLEKYLNKNMNVLDVGANIGFFSLYISDYVKSVDIVEYEPRLVKIAKLAKNKLDVMNARIFNQDIKKFNPDKKYHMIFSFAIHGWVGMPLDEYMKLLVSFLRPDGTILIESHLTNRKKDVLEDFFAQNKDKYKIIDKGVTDDHRGNLRNFYYVKPL